MTQRKGRREGGFTLIELIIVIVILGIIAAVAIPRYVSLVADAERGTASGVTAALRGSITVLHSRFLLSGTTYAYDATSVTGGVDAQDITLGAGAAVITATFASANTYTWTYTARNGNTPAIVTEAF